jgi:elongation factor Ts
MSISIDQIKSLRDLTGVSITLCKKALEVSNGDQEKAIEYLRKESGLKAAKASTRITNEGTIAIEIAGNKASIVKVACETDFVSKNENFKSLAQNLAKEVLNGKKENDLTSVLHEATLKTGESIKLLEQQIIEGKIIGKYIHSTGKLAAIVILDSGDENLTKDLCMQIVANNPIVIYPEDLKQEIIDKEKEIWKAQLQKEGKPENMWEKIMIGKEKKFREENALVTQQFIKDPEKKIKDLLGNIKIEKMMRISL